VTAAPPAPATLDQGFDSGQLPRKGCASICSRQLASPVPVASPATGIQLARLRSRPAHDFHAQVEFDAGYWNAGWSPGSTFIQGTA